MTKQEVEDKTFNDKLRSLILKLNTINSNKSGKVLKVVGHQAQHNKPNYTKFMKAMTKTGTSTQEILKSMILDQEIKQELNVLFTEYGLKGLTNPYAFKNAPKIFIKSSEIRKMKALYNDYNFKGLINILEDNIIAKVNQK